MRILLTCLVLLLPVAAAAQDAPRLTVQGVGAVATAPDMATVVLGVTREADTAEAAMAALSDATDAVLTRVREEGIAPEDVQTGQLSLQPRWDHGEGRRAPEIAGYVARTTLEVRVRVLDRLGPLMDAAVADGANGLEGLRFGLNDPDAVEAEARRAAFSDAMARAGIYAEAAGMTLGPIVTLSEAAEARPPGPAFAMVVEEAARSMPVAPGEVTQTITVTLTVELTAAE